MPRWKELNRFCRCDGWTVKSYSRRIQSVSLRLNLMDNSGDHYSFDHPINFLIVEVLNERHIC